MIQESLDTHRISLAGVDYIVDLAVSEQSKWQGLSDRVELATNTGILFVWDSEEPRRFSMRRMNFSIDILFLDRNGLLINKCANVPPWSGDDGPYCYSERPAMYVLEVGAGTCEERRIAVGSRVLDVATLGSRPLKLVRS